MLLKGYLDRFEAALDDASKTDRDTLLTMLARIDGVLSEQKEGKG